MDDVSYIAPSSPGRIRHVLLIEQERRISGGKRPRRRGPLLKLTQYVLVTVGGVALGWCAGVVTNAHITQSLARETLTAVPALRAAVTTPATVHRPAAAVKNGTPLAALSIPRLGFSAMVLQGSDERTLGAGVGHIEQTPLPGESGNVAIAGHRDSFFRPLRNIRVGDEIVLDTPERHIQYRVATFHVVSPFDVSVIAPTGNPVLTLITCYPFWFIGAAPDRFVVQANLKIDTVFEGRNSGSH